MIGNHLSIFCNVTTRNPKELFRCLGKGNPCIPVGKYSGTGIPPHACRIGTMTLDNNMGQQYGTTTKVNDLGQQHWTTENQYWTMKKLDNVKQSLDIGIPTLAVDT